MKKTIKVNLALYTLSEENLDNLASEFCGNIAAIAGKMSSHEIIFEDDITDSSNPECTEILTGEANAALFQYALTQFKKGKQTL